MDYFPVVILVSFNQETGVLEKIMLLWK